MSKRLAFILPLAIAATIASSASGAPDPATAPCTGVVLTDPKGDDTIQPMAVPVSGPHSTVGAHPQLDIRNTYFTYRNDVLTGYLTVTNLNKDIAEGAPDDQTWWVEFDLNNGVTSLKAVTDGSEVKFYYGAVEALGGGVNRPTTYVETTGKFIEGPDGVVAIDFPKGLGPKVGEELTGVYGMTTYNSSSTDAASRTFADRAPDDGATSAKKYKVTPCPDAAPPATPDGNGAPAPGTPPPSQGGSGSPQPETKPPAKKKKRKLSCKAKAKKIKSAKKRRAAMKRCARKKKGRG